VKSPAPCGTFFPQGAGWQCIAGPGAIAGAETMSKGMDQKRDAKKKPAKTLLEKRAAKAEKHQKKKQ
jgi:hypothetical protein